MPKEKTKNKKNVYLYRCTNEDCGELFENTAAGSKMFPNKPKKKCPVCDKRSLELVLEAPFFYVTGNNGVTIGTYAERRRKQLGEAECVEREMKREEGKKKLRDLLLEKPLPRGMKRVERPKSDDAPWWRPNTTGPDKSLNSLTNEQKTRYIMTGEKPLSDKGLRAKGQ